MNTKDKYHRYLKSNWWKEIRDNKIKKEKSCFICFSETRLLLHHYSYKNIYKASKTKSVDHTIVLCFDCHNIVHQIQHKRKVSYEATKKIVNDLRRQMFEAFRRESDIKREYFNRCG